MIRVIRIHRTGGPEVLELETIELAKPGSGEALVRHSVIGLNFIDTYYRKGLYPLSGLPHILGSEASGTVESVGEGVQDIKAGDRVGYAGGIPGAYADARIIRADRLVLLPEDINDSTAAAALLKGMTAEYLIRRTFKVLPGMAVLFHAAAGGVGLIACQWLKRLGATVIGTVSTKEKARLAMAHGCDQVIIYTEKNFAEEVHRITGGKGVAVVYDGVGKETLSGSLDSLAPRGMMVSFGNASGLPPAFDTQELNKRGALYLTRPSLHHYTATRSELLASASALFEVIRSGAVKINIHKSWPMEQAAQAHVALESRQTTGSCLLRP